MRRAASVIAPTLKTIRPMMIGVGPVTGLGVDLELRGGEGITFDMRLRLC